MGMRRYWAGPIWALVLWVGVVYGVRASENTTVPDALVQGVPHLRSGRPDLAATRWLRDGLAATDPALQRSLPDLNRTLKALGLFEDWEVLYSRPAGRNCRVVGLAARFQQGSLFLRVVAFDREGREVLHHLAWSLDPVAVLAGQGPRSW